MDAAAVSVMMLDTGIYLSLFSGALNAGGEAALLDEDYHCGISYDACHTRGPRVSRRPHQTVDGHTGAARSTRSATPSGDAAASTSTTW